MESGKKIVAQNRKASHDYFLEERFECGIVLTGTEIKSVRKGKVQLKESFISFINGEAFIKGMSISAYDFGNRFNHDETRERKLLLHRSEITKLSNKVKLKGYTIVPTCMYLKNGKVKIELALAKGKKLYDKRQDLAKKDANRRIERELSGRY